jgi:hypothetical protein
VLLQQVLGNKKQTSAAQKPSARSGCYLASANVVVPMPNHPSFA